MRERYLVKFTFVILVNALPLLPLIVFAQPQSIEQTEAQLKSLYGLEKLKALNRLTQYYTPTDTRKAVRYGRQAVILGQNLFIGSDSQSDMNDRPELTLAYYQLGKALFVRKSYFESRDNLVLAQTYAEQIDNPQNLGDTEAYLSQIQAMIDEGEIKENFLTKTFGDLKVGQAISETTKDVAIETEVTLAQASEKKGNSLAAIEHYQKAVNMLKDKGDATRVVDFQIRIATLLQGLNQHVEAQKYLNEALGEIEASVSSVSQIDSAQKVITLPPVSLKIQQDKQREEQKSLIDLSNTYAREKNFEKSLEYYKLYQELSKKMELDSINALAEGNRRENEIMLLKQQKEIADLNVEAIEKEKERQVRLRNTSALVALLILVSSLVTFYFYVVKRREHRRLTIAYRDLDKTKVKLVTAEQRIVKLLKQHVSGDVAKELLMNFTDKLGERRFVCIMFLDIRDFTPMAEKLSPEEIITYQNNVFGFMIDIVQQHHGNINQLLGDGFMATFGAPVSSGNDCQNAFIAANEILQEVKERNEAGLIQKTKIGIGLHGGHVVTGNVGNESRKQYSVTGNPVIIASRVEQLNKEYKSQLIITEEVYEKLEKPLKLTQPFLEVEVKGRTHPVRILKIA